MDKRILKDKKVDVKKDKIIGNFHIFDKRNVRVIIKIIVVDNNKEVVMKVINWVVDSIEVDYHLSKRIGDNLTRFFILGMDIFEAKVIDEVVGYRIPNLGIL